MAQVRNLNEFRAYQKAHAYFEGKIMWASGVQDFKQAEFYLEAIHALRLAHKDFCARGLEFEGLTGQRSDLIIIDELVTSTKPPEIEVPNRLFDLLRAVLALPIFDSSDHYFI